MMSELKKNIRKLTTFHKKVAANDFYYVFNARHASIVERMTAIETLNAMKQGAPWKIVHNHSYDALFRMSLIYDIYSYGFDDLPIDIGERDKTQRVCRFCGKNGVERFRNKAHAIPEALGNKLLVCNEECDECNHTLNKIEDNFTFLMDFRRAIFNIRRKGSTKTPKIVGQNYVIQPDTSGHPELFVIDTALPEKISDYKNVWAKFEHKKNVVDENIYKALVKMALDLMPSERLSHFSNTIQWIKPKDIQLHPDSLPSILFSQLPKNRFYDQPVLSLFFKKSTDLETPYCTAILYIADIAYQFVLPFADIDKGRFKYDKNLETHRKKLNSFFNMKWTMQEYFNWWDSSIWVYWNIDLTQPNIHVLSKTASIFGTDKLEENKEAEEIEYPPLNPKDIKVHEFSKICFKEWYKGPKLSNEDFIDISINYTQPIIIFFPHLNEVQFDINVYVKDSNNTINYFDSGISIRLKVVDIFKYMQFIGNMPVSVDYHLSEYIIILGINEAEKKLVNLRTPQFKRCNMLKLLTQRVIRETKYIFELADGRHYDTTYKELHEGL